MTRIEYIEKTLRQIYGDFPTDDSAISNNLVNIWLSEGIAMAAKANYKENIAIDGIGFINNSFYSRFTGIAITSAGDSTWKVTLPEIPIGIGRDEGISTIQLVDEDGRVTQPFIPLSENQKTYFHNMRTIPNKILYYYEGGLLYILSTMLLNTYTTNVVMVSGGDGTDLDSVLNVPSDYLPIIDAYLFQQLTMQRSVPQDVQDEGLDAKLTT